MEPSAPEGLVNLNGEWYYEEYARGSGIGSLGLSGGDTGVGGGADPGARPRVSGPSGEQAPGAPGDRSMVNSNGLPPPPAPTEERRSILDLFRN
jgi:penicillin-binding protein 1A